MLKSYGVGWGGGGGPCDYCVSPSPFDLDFGTLDFGTSDSSLTIIEKLEYNFQVQTRSRVLNPQSKSEIMKIRKGKEF